MRRSHNTSFREFAILLAATLSIPVPAQSMPIDDRMSQAWDHRSTSPELSSLEGIPKANQPITLQQCLKAAFLVNPEITRSRASVERAIGRKQEAQDVANPSLVLQPADVYLHSKEKAAASIVATLPVDIAGIIRTAKSQAQFQEAAARLDYLRTTNQVALAVRSAFFAELRAEALVRVSVDNLQASLDRLHDASVRYAAQTAPYFDVVRAETDVSEARKQVIAATNAVSVSLGKLNTSIGVSISSRYTLDPTGALEDPESKMPTQAAMPGSTELPPAPPPDAATIVAPPEKAPQADLLISDAARIPDALKEYFDEAAAHRPEILEADALVAAAVQGVQLARRTLLPTMSLSAGYFDIRSSTGTPIHEPEALVSLNIPLYDAGIARDRSRQARADVESARETRRIVADSVALDVQRAYADLIQSREQLRVADQALTRARLGFQIARVRYTAGVASRSGVSPILELSDAQAALTLAQQNRTNALYDFNTSRARLDWATGKPENNNLASPPAR